MEDEMIISLYNKRSERAIEETQIKYGRACYGVAFGILRNNEDSEECVNDTYLRTWNVIPPEQPSRLGAFVCRITRNFAIDRHRAKNADKRPHETEVAIDELSECLPAIGDDPESRAVIADVINRFLASLSPTKRIVFMRRYFFSDTPREIAKKLHMTETNVYIILHRLRAKLKDYLGKEGIDV